MLSKIKYLILIMIMSFFTTNVTAYYDKLAYDFKFNDLDGSPLNLSEYKDKVIVVVNVASQCGFTSQYEDMQKVWEKYQKKGLIMLGIPSNDFGDQEPGNSKEIKNFCEAKFGITFPMTEKISVKGENTHPFYLWAKKTMENLLYQNGIFTKSSLVKMAKLLILLLQLPIHLQKNL